MVCDNLLLAEMVVNGLSDVSEVVDVVESDGHSVDGLSGQVGILG